MPTLQELLAKHNYHSEHNPTNGPRAKLLGQANRMLKLLAGYKTEQELDGQTTQYWWAPQSVNGNRRIVMRYGGKVVEGTATYAANTLQDVSKAVEVLKAVIMDSDDETWADEEARRKKK